MALQSRLFRGDSALEAAAVSDPAHIVPGATGEHVRKIQLALIQLDATTIAPDGIYGPATAAAVLAYKQKRNIVNRSYQTTADNIVGKMTIASLDREMTDHERRLDSGQICHCRDFPRPPDSGTAKGAGLAFAVSGPSVGAVLSGSPREQALGRVALATLWVRSARRFIALGKAQVLSGLPSDQFSKTEERKALVTHFKVHQIPNPISHLNLLDGVYQLIARTLASASTFFIDDPTTGDFANAHLGGFFHPTDLVLGRIRFGPAYSGKGELFQTGVLIHEAAHFVNKVIDHFASELPPLNGTPVNSSTGIVHSRNYAQLSFQEAAGNAYTYAQFALHAFKGFDKRIVPFDE
jgi:peptidoglycan hydrolase-like protein with peptidoglycan-binding domain